VPYRIEKALQVADTVMRRRDAELDEADANLLRRIHRQSSEER